MLHKLKTHFETELPRIERHAKIFFRWIRCWHTKQDKLQEVASLWHGSGCDNSRKLAKPGGHTSPQSLTLPAEPSRVAARSPAWSSTRTC